MIAEWRPESDCVPMSVAQLLRKLVDNGRAQNPVLDASDPWDGLGFAADSVTRSTGNSKRSPLGTIAVLPDEQESAASSERREKCSEWSTGERYHSPRAG